MYLVFAVVYEDYCQSRGAIDIYVTTYTVRINN